MDVDRDTMTEPFFQFGNHQVRVTIEDFEVADSVPAEERAGYRPVEPITGLIYGRTPRLWLGPQKTYFHISPGRDVRRQTKGRDFETYRLN